MRNPLLMDPALRAKFEVKYCVWKEKLLDLSGSNRLLNFRTTKVATVQITRPDIVREVREGTGHIIKWVREILQ